MYDFQMAWLPQEQQGSEHILGPFLLTFKPAFILDFSFNFLLYVTKEEEEAAHCTYMRRTTRRTGGLAYDLPSARFWTFRFLDFVASPVWVPIMAEVDVLRHELAESLD